MSALRVVSDRREDRIEDLRDLLVKPYLGKKNGVRAAIEALSTDAVLRTLWDLDLRGNQDTFWWNAEGFITALKQLPIREAIDAVMDLTEAVHRWLYETANHERLDGGDAVPFYLLTDILPGMPIWWSDAGGYTIPTLEYVAHTRRLLELIPLKKLKELATSSK